MNNFVFHNPTRIVFGPGELAKLGDEAARIGQRPMIVTGKRSTKASGVLDRVVDLLKKAGLKPTVFNEIEPNPRTTTIDKAAGIARDQKCDFVIGLGGGSPMDACKAIAIAALEEGPIWDYINHGQDNIKPITKALPVTTVPTLAATGSEANAGAVITNWESHEKAVLFHPLVHPRFTIIDPELTVTVNRDYTIDGGIDIIAHVIESFFTGPEETPLQDRFSMSIVRTVMEYLPVVIEKPDDINARSQIQWCSTVALCGIVNGGRPGGFPLHAMEHALSGHYDISHGRGLALLLPSLMAATVDARPAKFAFMARELFGLTEGSESELAQEATEEMNGFLKSVGRFLTMGDVGIDDDSRFEQMADDTIRIYGTPDGHLLNPKPLYKDDIVGIFEAAM